jgi:hypothetical protein
MSFAYPEFLLALAAISVPIIIHLFNFRRFKKIYFSDIRFLKDVEIETKSRNQLKNLLVLLSRILAVAFLVMAFSRPFLPSADNQDAEKSNSIVVYIDNSFSMNAQGESGILLEEAKAKAIEIGSAYKSGVHLHLLTNDFKPQFFRKLSFEEFKNEVASVRSSPQLRTFNQIVSRANGVYESGASKSLYFISDIQEVTSIPTEYLSDSLLTIYTVPIQAIINANIYIDSCWFDSPSRLPSQLDKLNVRIRNSGTENVENISVKLLINGVQRAVGTSNVPADSYEDVELAFTNAQSGMQLVELTIQDYPITYDDNYFLSFSLTNQINILSVNGGEASSYANNLFSAEANFNLTNATDNDLDYSILNSVNLVILNEVPRFSSGMIQEMMNYVELGGNLMIIPAIKPDLASTNELLLAIGSRQLTAIDSSKLKVDGVNLQSTLYKNVFTEWQERINLPTVSKHFVTKSSSRVSSERLMTLENGQSFLSSFTKGKGRSFVLTSALKDDWTNFHRHALFVPTLYNIALNSVTNGVSKEIIGSNDMIATKSRADKSEVLEVENLATESFFVPERVSRPEGTGIVVHNQIKEDGHYLLRSQEGDTIQPLSFNFNRDESDMNFLTPTEFKESILSFGAHRMEIIYGKAETLKSQVQELHDGKQLWRWFLLLALICLLFETILIRIL